MKKATLLAIFCVSSILGATAYGQQVDAAIGFNAVTARSASDAPSNYSQQSVGGGLTPSVSFDALLVHNLGVNAEFSWRARQNLYQPSVYGGSVPFRPLFYDFNAIWAPNLSKHFTPEVMAGIGAESTRFYNSSSCGFAGCTNYSSTNHFLGHFGGGIRYYVRGNLFVRPEAHVYLVHNNNLFSSPYATRYGVSLGYTFGRRN
jgi:hypothetical protein